MLKSDTKSECSIGAVITGADNNCLPSSIVEKIEKKHGKDIDTVKVEFKCDDDNLECILGTAYNKDTIKVLKQILIKPNGPAKSVDWLTDKDLNNVLKPISILRPDYDFIEYQMFDFYTNKNNSVDLYDWKKAYNDGIRYVSCIFNTDYTGGQGEHWFCIFIDLKSRPASIEFFNSAGGIMLQDSHFSFHKWCADTASKLRELLNFEVIYVNILQDRPSFQKGPTECGVFCLWYIIKRLMGAPYKLIQDQGGTDEDMIKNREILFSHT